MAQKHGLYCVSGLPVNTCSRTWDEVCKEKEEDREDDHKDLKQVLGMPNASRANKSHSSGIINLYCNNLITESHVSNL